MYEPDYMTSANTNKLKRSQGLAKLWGTFGVPLIIAAILIIGFLGYKGIQGFRQSSEKQNVSNKASSEQDGSISEDNSTTNPDKTSASAQKKATGSSTPGANSSTPGSSSAPSSSGTTNSTSIPAPVSKILDSIEKDGITNNTNIPIDTSDVPKDTKATFDRSTWKQTNSKKGTVKGTVILEGNPTTWTLVFNQVDGIWKITDYSIT